MQTLKKPALERATYAALLRECKTKESLEDLSTQISQSTYAGDVSLGNIEVQMYSDLGCPNEARLVFDRIQSPNVFSWNHMINAYARNGHLHQALALFSDMENPNSATWNSLISSCARYGDLHRARDLFQSMPFKDVISWNAMISAYAQNGHMTQAFEQYSWMKLEGYQPNKITFTATLGVCTSLYQGACVRADMHDAGLSGNAVTAAALVEMYGRLGRPDEAKRVFECVPQRDKILWTVMLSATAKNKCLSQANTVFSRLPVHDLVTATIMVSALAAAGHLQSAEEIFECIPQPDSMCKTTMVLGYAQSGHLEQARRLFDSMHRPQLVSWNVMITAYAQSGQGRDAVKLLQLMDMEGEQASVNTLSTVFDACAALGLFPEGKAIHGSFSDTGMASDIALGTSLISMYGRCGGVDIAFEIFQQMPERNLLTWTSIIAAYAQNGHGKRAIYVFHTMQLEGVEPDDIVFKNVIYACGQAGLAAKSWDYFRLIEGDYLFCPGIDHYKCMLDLLGRAGKLEEAEELIKCMPYEPDQIAWTSLLSACRVHGDKKRGARVAELSGPRNGGSYVLLSAIQKVS